MGSKERENEKENNCMVIWVKHSFFIIGYFLQTIQVFNSLSQSDIQTTQKDIAINYPLTTFLFYTGLTIFILSAIFHFFKIKITTILFR